MKKRLLLTALSAAAALPAGAAPGSLAAAASKHRAVALKNIRITPKTLRIRRGDSVTWTWGDQQLDAMHNVTSYGQARFRSSSTQLTGTYTVRFARKGTYTYHCTIHPGAMEAKIVVR